VSGVREGVVSTIVTVFNRPALVQQAVGSVLAQTYRPIEVVIVDDGSTDETAGACAAMAAQHPGVIAVVRQGNRGPAAASNAGLERATGEFVQFLDSDDLLAADKFARQVAGLRERADCGLSYCRTQEYVLGEPPTGVPSRRTGQQFDRLFPALVAGRLWPTPSPLYRRSVIDAVGRFIDSRVYQDWEFECRVAARDVRPHYCPHLLADVRATHAVEGRAKGQVTGERLVDYARVLERIAGHARHPAVTPRDHDRFARRVFAVARRCGAAGYTPEARRLLALALSVAEPQRRRALARFGLWSAMAGWRAADAFLAWQEHSAAAAGWRRRSRRTAATVALWRHRASEASHTVSGQPLMKWPALLRHRWAQRRSRGARA
jgi:glycosyltransferase involved in cell wall biosynthesis